MPTFHSEEMLFWPNFNSFFHLSFQRALLSRCTCVISSGFSLNIHCLCYLAILHPYLSLLVPSLCKVLSFLLCLPVCRKEKFLLRPEPITVWVEVGVGIAPQSLQRGRGTQIPMRQRSLVLQHGNILLSWISPRRPAKL